MFACGVSKDVPDPLYPVEVLWGSDTNLALCKVYARTFFPLSLFSELLNAQTRPVGGERFQSGLFARTLTLTRDCLLNPFNKIVSHFVKSKPFLPHFSLFGEHHYHLNNQ